jgi:plastocyanin
MAPHRLGRGATVALALLVPVVALVTVVLTLNVTDDPSRPAAAGATPSSGTAIAIENFRYDPDPVTVKIGTKVTVTNRDGTIHTLTANDESFDTGELAGGASGTITITKSGTYEYFCQIHNYMTGTIEAR